MVAEPRAYEASLGEPPEATYDVSLANPGEVERNTIVLGGVDVIVPLEMDVDGDPFQDDAVCLRGASGFYEHVLVPSDDAVRASREKRHLYYEFSDVPSGVYHVDVRIGAHWTTVLSGLLVSRGEARIGDTLLGAELPETAAAPADPGEPATDERDDDDDDDDDDCEH